MRVFAVMVMLMVMCHAVVVDMHMGVPSVALHAHPRPRHVGDPKADQQPGGKLAANALNPRHLTQAHANEQSHTSQEDAPDDMTHTTQRGDAQHLAGGPPSGAPEHDEGQVVIYAHEGVKHGDRHGRHQQWRPYGVEQHHVSTQATRPHTAPTATGP